MLNAKILKALERIDYDPHNTALTLFWQATGKGFELRQETYSWENGKVRTVLLYRTRSYTRAGKLAQELPKGSTCNTPASLLHFSARNRNYETALALYHEEQRNRNVR